MSKIDFSKRMVGELYPIIPESDFLGNVSFQDSFAPIQFIDKRVVQISNEYNFDWRITPLDENKVLIDKKSKGLPGCWSLNKSYSLPRDIFVTFNRQYYDSDEVPLFNQFELLFIADSPLFFQIKSFDGHYLSSALDEDLSPRYSSEIGCFLTDQHKDNPIFNRYTIWYLSITEEKPNTLLLKAPNTQAFKAVSEKVGFEVNAKYIKKLINK